MFTDFINRILGAERRPSVSNRLENNAAPSVIVKKGSNKTSPKSIPEKYRKDVALLQSKYGDAFKTGFCIDLTLQEALSLMQRERKKSRCLFWSNLISEKRTRNYTNNHITKKLNLNHYEKLFYSKRRSAQYKYEH